MNKLYYFVFLIICLSCSLIENSSEVKPARSENVILIATKKEVDQKVNKSALYQLCRKTLSSLPGKYNSSALDKVCSQILHRKKCISTEGIPIFHYEKRSIKSNRARILAIGAIHGDEESSASIIRSWMERLQRISPRSSWRLVPILNPDGRKLKTRMNYNKVDLNRNFPTENWSVESREYWEKREKRNPRRYPGPSAGSEAETQCAISHIKDFRPDLIISIHTPLGVLDFDGPKMNFPKYKLLPWRKLGHFPGSLGRYMWRDHKIPVLTIELKGSDPIKNLKAVDQLQDISGLVALMTK